MLKYRLLFGTLMVMLFVGLILFDGFIDGSLCSSKQNAAVQGSILVALLLLIAIPANLEFAKLASAGGAKMFLPITIPASMALSSVWYWAQWAENKFQFAAMFVLLVMAFAMLAMFVLQAKKFATEKTFENCGASLFAIIYLGLLASFVPAIRIDYNPVVLLMFIFTVKCSDIGAYTVGRICGKHKFSPVISPKKTWEGMAGACLFAAIVATAFAAVFNIMALWQAVLFGVVFAFCGQFGDLAESMLKRAAAQKDSANSVPGFGGALDIIDSPLATAVLAYLFFAAFI